MISTSMKHQHEHQKQLQQQKVCSNELSCAESLAKRKRRPPNYFKFYSKIEIKQPKQKIKRQYTKKSIQSTKNISNNKSSTISQSLIKSKQPFIKIIKDYNYENKKMFALRKETTFENNLAINYECQNNDIVNFEESIDLNFSFTRNDLINLSLINSELMENFNIDFNDIIGRDIYF